MHTEIVTIGTELLLGQIVDTNAAYLGRLLAENGIALYRKTTVGDNFDRVVDALNRALDRADVVLVSGGLGPTEDDITRDCVAATVGQELAFRQELFDQIAERFRSFKRPMTKNNRRQAHVPSEAVAIPNPNGTAPGFIASDERGEIICMPGVPHELEAMMEDSVLPHLRERMGTASTIISRVLKVCGVGESRVDDAIGDLMRDSENPTVALLASPEYVQIRLTARADGAEHAKKLLDAAQARIEQRLPGLIMGIDEATLEAAVCDLLSDRGWTLATAETATGGAVSQRLMRMGYAGYLGGLIMQPVQEPDEFEHAGQYMMVALRQKYNTHCALCVASCPAANRTLVLFASPEGDASWEFAHAGLDAISQRRAATLALEHVRRHLLK